MIPNVFVYGTLKPNGRYHDVAKRGGNFTAIQASILGFDLYHLTPEGYPAIIEGKGEVHGFLFTYNDIDLALPFLDKLEGCHLEPPEYHRIDTTCYPMNEPCWVYVRADVARLKQEGAVLLPDGHWQEPDDSTTELLNRI